MRHQSTTSSSVGRSPRENDKPQREGIFPTFFMAGFECSTFIWKDGQRKDYISITGHDRHLKKDYRNLMQLGLGTIREGIRWPMVDKGNGRYDWSSVIPFLEAANECKITVIWDLCHYGFPDQFDPFSEDCIKRFADYCHEAARLVCEFRAAPHFFTPVNEITFFSGAGTDMQWMYPFAKGRYNEFLVQLCKMSIAGVKAIREVDPEARMVHVDPIIYQIPETNDPELKEQAFEATYETAYTAWDILYGRNLPELGGSPEILDIVGVNVYSYCQSILKEDKTHEPLGPHDPRRKPLCEMLKFAYERYHRPIIIGETSGYQDKRAEWLRMVMNESLRALNMGIDLQGVCLYPCIDMLEWQSNKWAKIGIFDIEDADKCTRIPCEPYVQELRHWQKTLNRPEAYESAGPDDERVHLDEVRKHAEEWEHALARR